MMNRLGSALRTFDTNSVDPFGAFGVQVHDENALASLHSTFYMHGSSAMMERQRASDRPSQARLSLYYDYELCKHIMSNEAWLAEVRGAPDADARAVIYKRLQADFDEKLEAKGGRAGLAGSFWDATEAARLIVNPDSMDWTDEFNKRFDRLQGNSGKSSNRESVSMTGQSGGDAAMMTMEGFAPMGFGGSYSMGGPCDLSAPLPMSLFQDSGMMMGMMAKDHPDPFGNGNLVGSAYSRTKLTLCDFSSMGGFPAEGRDDNVNNNKNKDLQMTPDAIELSLRNRPQDLASMMTLRDEMLTSIGRDHDGHGGEQWQQLPPEAFSATDERSYDRTSLAKRREALDRERHRLHKL